MDANLDSVINDDEVLDFTQIIRRKFVSTVTDQGTKMPTDPKEAKVLLSALADLDKTALGKKRLKLDKEMNETNAQTIAAIAAEVKASAMLFGGNQPAATAPRPAPVFDDSQLPPLQTVDGEMDIGTKSESYDNFKSRYEAEHGKPQRRED